MSPLISIAKTAKTRLFFFAAADALFVVVAVWLALFLRFEGSIPARYFEGSLYAVTLLILATTVPLFLFFRLYSFTWVYVSTNDLLTLAKTLLLSFLLAGGIFMIFRNQGALELFPRSVIPVSYLLMFFLMGGLRFAKRAYLQGVVPSSGKTQGERMLIVGAGDAGAQLARSIISSSLRTHHPVGFVDDDPSKRGSSVHGLRVLGTVDDIPNLVSYHRFESITIALPSGGSASIQKAVEIGRNAGIKKIRVLPPISELLNGEVSLHDMREVQVEDLLGRASVDLDTSLIAQSLQGKVILITGAAGSIGSELSRQVARFQPALLVLLDQDESGTFFIQKELEKKFPSLFLCSVIGDIQNEKSVRGVFETLHPHVVFHAAAYKHVPLMEANPGEAVRNNIFGTLNVGKAALDYQAERFVFISTDKAVNPTSVMGATKRIGEMICQDLNQRNGTKFISVRFGNVLNSRGSVIPIFKEQIAKRGPVEVTHPDMKRYFMLTSEACLLVMQAGAMGEGGEVFVLDMGNPVRIMDLAREMIRLSGFEADKDIPIVFTGIRPGEKLFEDILTAEEGVLATHNQKIFQAKLAQREYSAIERLQSLREIIQTGNRQAIIEELQSIEPSYQPAQVS